jgi:tRNA threonylcarbamoyladenosine biosynthesis protein TsaE
MEFRKSGIFNSESVEQTLRFGRELVLMLADKDLVVLTGPLGAGKTCFIKGMALGLGIDNDEVKSPSFTLVNEYRTGRIPLYHLDLYRMKDASELYEIGWDDYLMREGIIVVEWGEKAEYLLPEKRIEIQIEIVSDNVRKIFLNFGEKVTDS